MNIAISLAEYTKQQAFKSSISQQLVKASEERTSIWKQIQIFFWIATVIFISEEQPEGFKCCPPVPFRLISMIMSFILLQDVWV